MQQTPVGRIVHEVIEDLKANPVDLLSNGGGDGERRYLDMLKLHYERTLQELVDAATRQGWTDLSSLRVLEVGSYLGVVSFGLRRLGFQVTAQDIPEFQNNARLQARYRASGIEFAAVNLKRYQLPYPSGHFDLVVMCEVLEHLNFNPLPVVKELNRCMKKGALLYLTVPNQYSAGNRLDLLRGRIVQSQASMDGFYWQLNPAANMIVGLHWREYSREDLHQLLEPMGFAIRQHCYFQESKAARYRRLKFSLKDLLGQVVPSLRPTHVVLAEKVAEDDHRFALTDAVG
jgi:SAM-dependent methyltransferase